MIIIQTVGMWCGHGGSIQVDEWFLSFIWKQRLAMFQVLLKQLLPIVPCLVTVVSECSVEAQGQEVACILQEHSLQERVGILICTQHSILQATLCKNSCLVKWSHTASRKYRKWTYSFQCAHLRSPCFKLGYFISFYFGNSDYLYTPPVEHLKDFVKVTQRE